MYTDIAEQERLDVLTGKRASSQDSLQIRIEALRAAATIVAGCGVGAPRDMEVRGGLGFTKIDDQPVARTLEVAKQFAAYLETGE